MLILDDGSCGAPFSKLHRGHGALQEGLGWIVQNPREDVCRMVGKAGEGRGLGLLLGSVVEKHRSVFLWQCRKSFLQEK